jgi:DNA-binding transcriptional regulator YiaG
VPTSFEKPSASETHEAAVQLRERAQLRVLPPPAQRREVRRSAGVTVGELAAVLGVSSAAVVMWERGSRVPSLQDPCRRPSERSRA